MLKTGHFCACVAIRSHSNPTFPQACHSPSPAGHVHGWISSEQSFDWEQTGLPFLTGVQWIISSSYLSQNHKDPAIRWKGYVTPVEHEWPWGLLSPCWGAERCWKSERWDNTRSGLRSHAPSVKYLNPLVRYRSTEYLCKCIFFFRMINDLSSWQ